MDDERARSIYALLVLTAWADGNLHPSEVLLEHAVLRELPELAALPDKRGLADAAKRDLDEGGLDTAVERAALPLRAWADRELAFTSCVRMLEADGVLAHQEFRVLRVLRRLFGFDAADISRMLGR